MEHIGTMLKQRLEQIIVENEMMRAGFAAVPYLVLRDAKLSVGARLAYAILLMYAWQEGSCFPGQQRMAEDLGVAERTLRRLLIELKAHGYVSWRKGAPGATNIYFIHDVHSKLKAEANRTLVSGQSGHGRPVHEDTGVRQIDNR